MKYALYLVTTIFDFSKSLKENLGLQSKDYVLN